MPGRPDWKRNAKPAAAFLPGGFIQTDLYCHQLVNDLTPIGNTGRLRDFAFQWISNFASATSSDRRHLATAIRPQWKYG